MHLHFASFFEKEDQPAKAMPRTTGHEHTVEDAMESRGLCTGSLVTEQSPGAGYSNMKELAGLEDF